MSYYFNSSNHKAFIAAKSAVFILAQNEAENYFQPDKNLTLFIYSETIEGNMKVVSMKEGFKQWKPCAITIE